MKKILFFFAIIIPISLCAQLRNAAGYEGNRLSEQIAQLYDYIQVVSDSHVEMKTRLHYASRAKELFIANCDAYEEYVTDSAGQTQVIQRKGVMIEVSSPRHPHSVRQLLRNYISGLANLRYQKIEIQSIEIAEVDVSSLRRIADNQYECICYFDHKYCGSRDGKPLYQDITRKKVRTIIELPEIESGLSNLYLFGDIRVISKQ